MTALISDRPPLMMSRSPKTGTKTLFEAPAKIAASAFNTLLIWQRRSQQRRHLMQMDARLLDDLGLSRSDVAHEVSKHFWQA